MGNSKPELNSSKKTKSKPPSILLFIKLNLLKKLLPSTTMLKEDKLTLKKCKLISKSNLLLKKKLSTNKKLTEEILNLLILIGLLTSSWNKLLPSVPLLEKELMTTFMTKDLMTCSPDNPMSTTNSDRTVSDQIE